MLAAVRVVRGRLHGGRARIKRRAHVLHHVAAADCRICVINNLGSFFHRHCIYLSAKLPIHGRDNEAMPPANLRRMLMRRPAGGGPRLAINGVLRNRGIWLRENNWWRVAY